MKEDWLLIFFKSKICIKLIFKVLMVPLKLLARFCPIFKLRKWVNRNNLGDFEVVSRNSVIKMYFESKSLKIETVWRW